MERLTIRDKDGQVYFVNDEAEDKAPDMLAEYEDATENLPIQEPSDLKGYIERAKWYVIKALELDNELKAFRDAEEQGLLVRLPCKVGDTVYSYDKGEVIELTVVSIEIRSLYFISFKTCHNKDYILLWADFEISKTVFLTKEEAEKALEGMKE